MKGYDFGSIGVPDMFRRPPIFIGRAPVPAFYAFIIAAGVAVAIALWVLLTRTRFGKIIRAAADNPTMVAALGINVAAVATGVFALGTFLAGLGGVLAAPVRSIFPRLPWEAHSTADRAVWNLSIDHLSRDASREKAAA